MIQRFPFFISLVATITFLAPAASPAAEDIGKAHPAVSEKVQCLPLYMIDQTRVLDDKTILFEMKNGAVWRNELPSACPGLKREDRFSYKTSIGQLCNLDLITVLPAMGIPGPSCGLGMFVRVPPETGKSPGKDEKNKAGQAILPSR